MPLDTPAQLLALAGGVVAVIYPFLKRFFPLPQGWLGIAFAWSVPMAFAEQTGTVPTVAWYCLPRRSAGSSPSTPIYAMVDREDDLKLGVRSSAILFGRADRVAIGLLQVGSLAALAVVGELSALGTWYWLGLAAAATFAAWQQWLIRDRDPAACLRAFLNNNWFGLAVFAGIALDYLFK